MLVWDLCIAGMWIGARAFYLASPETAWKYGLALHVFSWWIQVHVGHMICEGRKPSLLDSLFQSLVLAPLFVWFEFLFLFGWNAELRVKLEGLIQARIAIMDKNKKE